MNWDQLRTMLWLRWRLTRNQWSRGGQINAIITLLAVVVGLGLAVVGGIAGVLGGALGLSRVSPVVLMWIWDGLVGAFLFFWMIGIVSELQRSEIIDLSRLMHLPVSLRDIFVLNYVSSHLSLSIAIMLPATLGLTAGLVFGRSPLMILLFPLVAGFFFMVTAWTYCLRGWLAALMVNKRRRRAIVMGITLAFVLIAQLPNLITNVWIGQHHHGSRRTSRAQQTQQQAELLRTATFVHEAVPFLWLPYGARTLAGGNIVPTLLGTLGLFGLGALGLHRAYRSTLNFYRGGTSTKTTKAPAPPRVTQSTGTLLVERRLPGVPEEAAALAMANFRSMTRAPEVKMALAMNVFIFGMIGASIFLRGAGKMPPVIRPLAGSGAVFVTFLGLTQVLFNQFGFDRDAFRSLVLLPVRRQHMLLGKNLSLLPFALIVFTVLLILITVLAALPAWVVITVILQFAGAFLLLSSLGNLASILAPYRIAAGSLKPTKMKATATLMLILVQMMFPLAMFPVLIPAGLGILCDHFHWAPGAAVNLLCSTFLPVMGCLVYWRTLRPLGELLQRREKRILEVVTQEVE